jgi:hypothetical protein
MLQKVRRAIQSKMPSKLVHLAKMLRYEVTNLLTSSKSRLHVFLVSSKAYLIRNYFNLHLFAIAYSLIGIPIQITLFAVLPSIFQQTLATLAIVVPVFSASLFWRAAATANPNLYIRTLKLKQATYLLFWILISSMFLLLLVIWLSVLIRNDLAIKYSLRVSPLPLC